MPTHEPPPRRPRYVHSTRADISDHNKLPAVVVPDPTGHHDQAGRKPEPSTPEPRTSIRDDVLGRGLTFLTVLGLITAVTVALVEQSPIPMSIWSGACIAVALWAGYRGLLFPGPAWLLAAAAGMSLGCWLGGPWWLVLAGLGTTVAAVVVQTLLAIRND